MAVRCASMHGGLRRYVLAGASVCGAALVAAVQVDAVGFAAPRPKMYAVSPERHCERVRVYTDKGIREELAPPAPGLTAVALARRKVRITWTLSDAPSACRQASIFVGIVRFGRAAPFTRQVTDTHRSKGSIVMSYCACLPAPDVALASTYGKRPLSLSSRTVEILIRRP
jgi:hypothetical protein